jgi:hypothetical protein
MPVKGMGQNSGNDHVLQNVTARPRIKFLLVFLVLLPGIVAFGILYRQALPLPYQDDYGTILSFAADYDQLPSVATKGLYIAAAQSNEYKLGFEHSIVAAEIEVTHHLNFAFLTALGDLFLLPLAYLLWRTYRGDESEEDEGDLNRRLLAFLPISFLFFSLTYWENLNWTTTGLVNIPVIFFSLLAIYLLLPRKMIEPTRARLLLACLAAVLAAFSSANGFLLGPVGLLILFTRRAYARSLVWCASFLLPLAAYLYHYTRLVHPADIGSYATRPLFFLAFLGCGAIPFRWPAAVLGIVILRILWLALRTRFDRTNPVAVYFTVWIVATAALVAWVRGAVSFAVGGRYSIYSILVLIFCYCFLGQYLPDRWPEFDRRRFYRVCLTLAVCICVLADIHAYRKLDARRQMVLSGIELYRANPQINSPMIDQNLLKAYPDEAAYERDSLTNAIQKHIYTLPPK